jgi:hypothetical protein
MRQFSHATATRIATVAGVDVLFDFDVTERIPSQ